MYDCQYSDLPKSNLLRSARQLGTERVREAPASGSNLGLGFRVRFRVSGLGFFGSGPYRNPIRPKLDILRFLLSSPLLNSCVLISLAWFVVREKSTLRT